MKLKNMEVKINDEEQALILLCLLPSSYAHFVDTFICGRDSISMEIVKLSPNSSEMRKELWKETVLAIQEEKLWWFVEDLFRNIVARVLIKGENQCPSQKSRNRCSAFIARKWVMLNLIVIS